MAISLCDCVILISIVFFDVIGFAVLLADHSLSLSLHLVMPPRQSPSSPTKFRCREANCDQSVSRGDLCAPHLKETHGVSIKRSKIPRAGLGLFCERERVRGDKIVEYLGRSLKSLPSDTRYVLRVSSTHFIDGIHPCSGSGRYCNTARSSDFDGPAAAKRTNNATFSIDRVNQTATIKATKSIAVGEEVLVAYGRGYGLPRSPQKPKKKKKEEEEEEEEE